MIQRVTDGHAPPVDREILIQITGVDLTDADFATLESNRFHKRHIEHRFDEDTAPAVWFPPAAPHPVMNLTHRDAMRRHAGALVDLVYQLTNTCEPGTVIAVPESDAATIVAAWTGGTNVVGLDPEFDLLTLSLMLDRHGYRPQPWNQHLTNIATEAAGWLRAKVFYATGFIAATAREFDVQTNAETMGGRLLGELTQLPRHTGRLAELCDVAAITDEETQTALGGARWIRRWWDAITPQQVNR